MLNRIRMYNKSKAARPSKPLPSQIQLTGPGSRIEDPFACDVSPTSSLPPSLVIRATSDYEAKGATELSFTVGEFFHASEVFTDTEGVSWYRAENPLKSVQGIVPSACFQKYGPSRPANLLPIGKGPSSLTKSQLLQTFAKGKGPIPTTLPVHQLRDKDPSSLEPSPPAELKPSHAKYQSLFGTMKYTFVAERPDELSARYGEPVIIMAHSAQEWFVVKPIGRLGGPGFIPVSYVELQDIKTCRVLPPEQGREMITTSVIPTVEQWKDQMASYKACSITLGAIAGGGSTSNELSNDLTNPLQLGSSGENPITASADQGTRNDTIASHDQHTACHTAASDNYANASDDVGSRVTDWRERQATFIQCAQEDDVLSLVEEEEEDEITLKARIRKRYGILQKINLTSFHHEQAVFWYQVHAHFSSPERTEHSTRRRALVIYRLETNFEALESDLQSEFRNTDQVLPKYTHSPPPADEMACARRLEELRDYFDEVSRSSELIRTSEAICEFLSHRQGDMELDDSDSEASLSKSAQSNSHLNPPTLELPFEAYKPFSTAENLRQTLMNSQKIELTDDVRSWITSCEAATPNGASPDEFDFSLEGPSCSTQPSSIATRSPSPIRQTKKSPDSSVKSDDRESPTSSRHSHSISDA